MTRPSPWLLPTTLLSVLLGAQCPGQEEGRHWFSRGSGATQDRSQGKGGHSSLCPRESLGWQGLSKGRLLRLWPPQLDTCFSAVSNPTV